MTWSGLARAACTVGAAATLLIGCASPRPSGDPSFISGRLAVRIDDGAASPTQTPPASGARSVTASFELRGDDARGDLRLFSPLGNQLALARWDPAGATLTTSEGLRSYGDLTELARDALGAAMPLGALTYWLAGRPWPGAEVRTRPGQDGFEQLGWAIDLARFASDALIVAHRDEAPAVTVRARLDRPH